jgi:hypothetical protein
VLVAAREAGEDERAALRQTFGLRNGVLAFKRRTGDDDSKDDISENVIVPVSSLNRRWLRPRLWSLGGGLAVSLTDPRGDGEQVSKPEQLSALCERVSARRHQQPA